MSAPVTLPGDLPGLSLLGAPLRFDEGREAVGLAPVPHDPSAIFVAWVPGQRDPRVPIIWVCSVSALELVLSPPGMDIAARWLAERLGFESGWTAPRFWWSVDIGAWCLSSGGRIAVFRSEARDLEEWRDPTVWSYIAVPGLPIGPAKGPEALARICLHVAGRRTP